MRPYQIQQSWYDLDRIDRIGPIIPYGVPVDKYILAVSTSGCYYDHRYATVKEAECARKDLIQAWVNSKTEVINIHVTNENRRLKLFIYNHLSDNGWSTPDAWDGKNLVKGRTLILNDQYQQVSIVKFVNTEHWEYDDTADSGDFISPVQWEHVLLVKNIGDL